MLLAGAASIDITPPIGAYLAGHFKSRKSTGIHDPLTAACLVISDGETELALVGCDLILISAKVSDAARALIAEDCGIPEHNVMLWATHTHAGPLISPNANDPVDEEYLALLPRKLAGGVRMAKERLAESEISVAVGREEGIAFNRRYVMRDGTTMTNPGVGNPNILERGGPIDPDVGCLFIRSGETLPAVLVNFACHLDVLGDGNHLMSADYPYYMRDALHAAGLSDAVVLFANGACGDLNHINVFAEARQGGYEHCEKMGKVLAGEALKCLMQPEPLDAPRLAAKRTDIELPFRPFSEEEIAGFRATLADDAIGERDFRKLNAASRLARVEGGITGQRTQVQALRIGELGIVGIPAEYFVELGLRIKQESPAATTFVVELAYDCVGYVPTQEAVAQGAYEGQSARFVPEAGDLLAEESLSLLQALWTQ